jgi:hypothetical protein
MIQDACCIERTKSDHWQVKMITCEVGFSKHSYYLCFSEDLVQVIVSLRFISRAVWVTEEEEEQRLHEVKKKTKYELRQLEEKIRWRQLNKAQKAAKM